MAGFKSEAQRRKLQQINPQAAALMEAETPPGVRLPPRAPPKVPQFDGKGRPVPRKRPHKR